MGHQSRAESHQSGAMSQRLHKVQVRLFADDIKELKRRAQEERLPWQVKLRLFINRALKEETFPMLKVGK